MKTILWFSEISKEDVVTAGGKGANLGEMARSGLPVPNGFVVISDAYFAFLGKTGIRDLIVESLANLNVNETKLLNEASRKIKEAIFKEQVPPEIAEAVVSAYGRLGEEDEQEPYVAVRSSATAEDLPSASFAGQQITFLNVRGADRVVDSLQAVWASLFEPRSIFYRATNNFDHLKVGIAVPVQKMVQSEKSGVMFTVDTVTNDRSKIEIEAGLGLGEAIVSGSINPDRYLVDKETLEILDIKIAKQTWKIAMDEGRNRHLDVPASEGEAQKLSLEEIRGLAELGKRVEEHYGVPQDIEWAIEKDRTYLVQTRPVTTLKQRVAEAGERISEGEVILEGIAASFGTASGRVRVIESAEEIDKVEEGDVLVTTMTSPDYVPAMRRAAAIITDTGGRTAHAAIVSRELGIPCVVGTGTATTALEDGQTVTVDGSKGIVMKGEVKKAAAEAAEVKMAPAGFREPAPVTATKVYVNLGESELAEQVAGRPVDGVGLLRAEFMIAGIGEHPRAMMRSGRGGEFVDKLSGGLKLFAQAFFPRPVVYRATDFKTNEYRNLKGGREFEPSEGNPMIGYRGAARYVHEPDLFRLELQALRETRNRWGLKNLHLMIPFVRTVDEIRRIGVILDEEGMRRSPDFKLWMMVEVPSNVFLIDEFCRSGIDGVSIGSNDLTQLILGVDRDSEILAEQFDERNEAVVKAIKTVIEKAEEHGLTSSLCGQAPSVYPEIAEMLVEFGITSISVNPDVIEETRKIVAAAEQKILLRRLERVEKIEKKMHPPEVA
ncbi:MAG: phosphoenolpyruvate synthase [Candidatus Aquicultorales bacterium]